MTEKAKSMVSYKEKLLARATAREAAVKTTDSGYISFRGGKYSWSGDLIGPDFDGIVLDEAVEYSLYTTPWNPDTVVAPDCFALSPPMSVFDGDTLTDGLIPHAKAPSPQAKACDGCPMNEWGSGTGRGKACSNRRRLLVASKDLVDVGIVKLPPTGLKVWDTYAKTLTRFKKVPPEGVLTKFTLAPATASAVASVPAFEFVRELVDEELAKVFELQELYAEALVKPFER